MDSSWKPQLPFGFEFGGWLNGGIKTERTTPFNQPDDQILLNQAYICVQRQANGANGWDWGFRADGLYGVDGLEAQSRGNNPGNWDFQNGFDHGEYGWAIPQLYGEVAMGDLNVKAGHFYTLLGYEVVTAPDNFFYSHALTMANGEPFTHTGALASYAANENITVYGGWTLGWDTGFDQFDSGSNFIGGITANITDNVSFSFMTTIGDFGKEGEGYAHTMLLDVRNVANFESLRWLSQFDYSNIDKSGNDVETIGLNQYLFYTINQWLDLGGRFEFWWQDNGFSSDETYSITGGANLKPAENLIVRPEIRHTWYSDPFRDSETAFAADMILTY